jgi:Ni/Co efflux regulator RcnB
MRALTLVMLAASAAGFAPAMAQTVPDTDYGVAPDRAPPPPARMRNAPPPGTTWHSNGPPMQVQQMQQMQMPPPQMGYGQQGQSRTFVVHRNGQGPAMGQRRHMEYRHIERGGTVPNRWWGRNVQVRNWRMYGFPQPFAGGRWIRYYDDALLIDGGGRVYDSRPGWDWDRYGDRWSYEDDGVPVYGDEEEDYRSERYEHAERYDHRGMGPGPQVRERVYVQQAPMPMGPPPCGNMCGGGGYGYGAGYGAVLVTETIVTYETVRVPVKHRRHVVRCGCRRAPPPAYSGERG